jgi:hypothetical protein
MSLVARFGLDTSKIRRCICPSNVSIGHLVAIVGSQNGVELVDKVTFPFHYPVIKELPSSAGVEIRIWLENDVPFGGEYGTATFIALRVRSKHEEKTAKAINGTG